MLTDSCLHSNVHHIIAKIKLPAGGLGQAVFSGYPNLSNTHCLTTLHVREKHLLLFQRAELPEELFSMQLSAKQLISDAETDTPHNEQ